LIIVIIIVIRIVLQNDFVVFCGGHRHTRRDVNGMLNDEGTLACIIACLPACPPACLPACVPVCLPACVSCASAQASLLLPKSKWAWMWAWEGAYRWCHLMYGRYTVVLC
jgi:hypothetical protein